MYFLKHKCPGDVVPLRERVGSIVNNKDLILLTHFLMKDLKLCMMSFYQTRVLSVSDLFGSWCNTCGWQVSSEEHGDIHSLVL